MTESTSDQPVIPSAPAPQTGAPKAKIPSTIAFAIGIVLFFMPFVDIQCNNMSLQKVSGAELATGFKIKSPGTGNSLFDGLDKMGGESKTTVSSGDKKDPNVYALAALALGGIGLLLSITNAKLGGIGGVLTGALSAASLIGLWIDIRHQLKTDIGMDNQTDINIAVEFTPWFYLAIVSFITAAYFSYKRMKT